MPLGLVLYGVEQIVEGDVANSSDGQLMEPMSHIEDIVS